VGVIEVRGLGLMIGVEFDTPERADLVANLCFRRGLLVLECGTKAIRISPPLILTRPQADTVADVFITACEDAFHDRVAPAP
jgi:4-aminobutyrate aminotransferase